MVLAVLLSIIVSGGVGFFFRHLFAVKERNEKQGKADEIIVKARKDASDLKYKARKEAKEAIREERHQAEEEVRKRQKDVKSQEKSLVKRRPPWSKRWRISSGSVNMSTASKTK